MKKEISYYPPKGSLPPLHCRQERGEGHQVWSQQKPSHPIGGHGCCGSWCQDFHRHRSGCAVSHPQVVQGGLPSLEKGLGKALMGTGSRWGAGGCCNSDGLPLPEPRTRLWIWKRMSMCLFAGALVPPPSHSSLTWQQEREAHDASHPASSFSWQARLGLGLSRVPWGSRELPPPPACVSQHDRHLSTASLPASPTNLFAHDCWQSKKGAYQKQLFSLPSQKGFSSISLGQQAKCLLLVAMGPVCNELTINP